MTWARPIVGGRPPNRHGDPVSKKPHMRTDKVEIAVVVKSTDMPCEMAQQEVVFQRDAVFERLVPAFDLTLGLGTVF